MPSLPAPFVSQMSTLLGADYEAFAAALAQSVPVSIRRNPNKPLSTAQLPAMEAAVPWHPQGHYLPERPVFTLDPAWHAGAYYVQEAASMLLYQALVQTHAVTPQTRVLDLCAAPGGKSTLLAAWLNGEGLLVANEVIRTRTPILRENLERWGSPNVAVTQAEAAEFAATLPNWFDVVVVDAPCSGEGLFRKDPKAMHEWSPAHVGLCQGRQRSIVAEAVQCVKPGGLLVYSTCTYNNAENDHNTTWICQQFGLEIVPLHLPDAWGIVSTQAGGYQCFPHRVRGEGFFLSVMRKPEGHAAKLPTPTTFQHLRAVPKTQRTLVQDWIDEPAAAHILQTPTGMMLALPAALEAAYLQLDSAVRNKWFGTILGTVKGQDFIPEHALAKSTWCSQKVPTLPVEKGEALLFLKKESWPVSEQITKGWALVTAAGLGLGWVKILPNRLNNYLPPERRIRMDIID